MLQQPITPVIIDLAEPATERITAGDVLVGALGFAGGIAILAVVLAVLFAAGLVWLRRLSPSNSLNGDETDRTRLGLHLPSS